MEKMKKRNHIIFILLLTAIDIVIKKYILFTYSDRLDQCSGGMIHFHPKYNEAGSFVNDRFGVGFSQVRFEIFLLLFIVLLIKLWFDLQKECINKGYNQKWMYVYDLFIAACFARAFERLGGRYTLDYLAIKNIGILDTGDIYIVIGAIGMGIFGIYCVLKSKELKNKTML